MDQPECVKLFVAMTPLNQNECERLEKQQFQNLTNLQWTNFRTVIKKHKHTLTSNAECECPEAITKRLTCRMPQMHGNPKMHQLEEKGLTFRPVSSNCGSFLEPPSKWVDHKLKDLPPHATANLKNTDELMTVIDSMDPLPPGAKSFVADADSMHTNMRTAHAMPAMTNLINASPLLPPRHPRPLLTAALQETMSNHLFAFGDTHWMQNSRAAMGTLCAVMHATSYFAIWEEKATFSPVFMHMLLSCKQHIDDVFGIWQPHGTFHQARDPWDCFQHCMNGCGDLAWKIGKLSDCVAFLDLETWINSKTQKLEHRTHQKPMNLHQCMPPRSAHPATCLTGMTCSILRACWQNNSLASDYGRMAGLFFDRITAVGWQPSKIKKPFMLAAKRLDTEPTTNVVAESDKDDDLIIFTHEFHPHGLPRKQIRAAFDCHCADLLPDSKLTAAQCRPCNIKDRVTSSIKLRVLNNGANPSDFIPN